MIEVNPNYIKIKNTNMLCEFKLPLQLPLRNFYECKCGAFYSIRSQCYNEYVELKKAKQSYK